MKKAFLILLTLIPFLVFAQNSDKDNSKGVLPSEQKMIFNVFEKTAEMLRVGLIPRNAVTIDTLLNVDTIVVYNLGNYTNLQFDLTDTSSTTTDTVIIERKDTASATYNQSIQVKDLGTNSIVSDTLVVAAGKTKSYLVNESNPFTYRLRRINTIGGRTWVTIWRKQ